MSTWQITDIIGDDGTVTVEDHDVMVALGPWFVDAPTEVYDAILQLETALLRGNLHLVDGLAQYLGITVKRSS